MPQVEFGHWGLIYLQWLAKTALGIQGIGELLHPSKSIGYY